MGEKNPNTLRARQERRARGGQDAGAAHRASAPQGKRNRAGVQRENKPHQNRDTVLKSPPQNQGTGGKAAPSRMEALPHRAGSPRVNWGGRLSQLATGKHPPRPAPATPTHCRSGSGHRPREGGFPPSRALGSSGPHASAQAASAAPQQPPTASGLQTLPVREGIGWNEPVI